MFDIKWIRENPEAFDRGLKKRSLEPKAAELLEIDQRRRDAQTKAQSIQQERKALNKEIGQAKAKGEDATEILEKVKASKSAQSGAEDEVRVQESALRTELLAIDNLPADDVPEGEDETANVELRTHGDKPKFDFEAKEHFELGEALGAMDFERAAKLSGSRFVVLSGQLARLERALGQFMLDVQTGEHGYREVNTPLLVRDDALIGTGQLPKFKEDLITAKILREGAFAERFYKKVVSIWSKLSDSVLSNKEDKSLPKKESTSLFDRIMSDTNLVDVFARNSVEHAVDTLKDADLYEELFLIPTAEVPLTNLVAGEILDEGALPMRMTALTACFRAEAGAAGKDTRGMLRQHQFYKVELVSIAHPDRSAEEHERMTECAEEVLKRLDLHFRTMILSSGDMGFAAQKTYDIEVWLPGQKTYREISSCSNCGDFQARRMGARYRPDGEKGTRFVHTLNGSGIAVGRALIAVMENYQQEDGSIAVPDVLQPYMGGLEVIERDA